MPALSRIILYPVKALAGVEVESATLLLSGALRHDRRYALVGADGRFINGKNEAAVHRLDARCALDGDTALLTLEGCAYDLGDAAARPALEAHLSRCLGRPVSVLEDDGAGYPDDEESPGPTVVSVASLETVAGWFPGMGVDEARRRFRANLELSDCPAFWEDGLYGEEGEAPAFTIGAARLLAVNPCRRCVVPSRDPATGEALAGFQRSFVARRGETLPPWARRSRFDFLYRLAVNTRLAPGGVGAVLRVGDPVSAD